MSLYNGNNAANFREYADSASFDITRITVAVWAKSVTHTQNSRYVCRGGGGLAGEWLIGTISGTPFNQYRFSIRDGAGTQINATDPATFTDGTLTHLCGVYDGSNAILYKNGTSVATAAMTVDPIAQATAIRTHVSTAGSNQGDVELGEFAFWNVALTAAEVAALGKGIDPRLIRPSALVIYDSLHLSAGKDRIAGLGTDNGTLTEVNHPPIFTKQRARTPDSGNAPVASTINGGSTVTANVTTANASVASTINGGSTVTANVTPGKIVQSTILGGSTVTANVSRGVPVATTILGGSSVQANVIAGNANVAALITGASLVQLGQLGKPPGGYGIEAFGDPFGAGGPLSLKRVRAVASHVIRVVFNEEPLHQSAAGKYDSRNPSNYLVEAVSGTIFGAALGTVATILAVGVDPEPIFGPTKGVLPGEVAMDIHLDKAVVQEVIYKVTVNQIRARHGGILGFPYTLNFPGILPTKAVNPPRNLQPLFDFNNVLEIGHWIIDDSGDLRPEDQITSLKKRVIRRLTTTKGAFAFLPSYGIGLALKEPMSISSLQTLKQDITKQIKQEPEVDGLTVLLSLNPLGLLIVTINIKTKAGAVVNVQATRTPQGTVLL